MNTEPNCNPATYLLAIECADPFQCAATESYRLPAIAAILASLPEGQ